MESFFTNEQWDWVSKKIHEGYAQSDIAAFLGVHRETVRRAMIRHGLRPVRRDQLPPLSNSRDEFMMLGRKHQ